MYSLFCILYKCVLLVICAWDFPIVQKWQSLNLHLNWNFVHRHIKHIVFRTEFKLKFTLLNYCWKRLIIVIEGSQFYLLISSSHAHISRLVLSALGCTRWADSQCGKPTFDCWWTRRPRWVQAASTQSKEILFPVVSPPVSLLLLSLSLSITPRAPRVQFCQSSKWHVVTIRFRRPRAIWSGRRLNGGGSTYIREG